MATQSPAQNRDGMGGFAKRVLVVLLLLVLTFAAWRLADLILLLFGAVLVAVGLRAMARALARATGIGTAAGLAVVIVLSLAGLTMAFWFFGTIAAAQLDEIARQAPAGLRLLFERLQSHPYGRYIVAQARDVGAAGATGWAASILASVTRLVARAIGYAILTFVVAIYLAAQPGRYRRMGLRLIPLPHRGRVQRACDDTADLLQRWLLGQLIVMTTIGILSGIGLWALGIEAAFALGLVGGLLTFIPFFGAVLAAIPAVLVALTQGPFNALSVVAMYGAIHFVEGNFITPLVQAEATALPPVLSMLSVVTFSGLFGPSAVLLAVPLALVLSVVAEGFYPRPPLDNPEHSSSHPIPTQVHPKAEQ